MGNEKKVQITLWLPTDVYEFMTRPDIEEEIGSLQRCLLDTLRADLDCFYYTHNEREAEAAPLMKKLEAEITKIDAEESEEK